jgi:hypothetical protein
MALKLDHGNHHDLCEGSSMGGKRQRRTKAELDNIDAAIIEAIEADRPVTLRGVFYRVVSMGVVPKTDLAYRTVGKQLLKLRRQGRVSYAHITDGTRWTDKPGTWASLNQMLASAAKFYRRDIWHDQGTEVHIYSEKDAISGVIQPVTRRLDVTLGVIRGYSSESFAWEVAQAVCESDRDNVWLYQLGDHDPSGVDLWRDLTAKIAGFAAGQNGDTDEWLHFERLAVTEQQITEWQLPTRPTKATDSRSAKFAGDSVEVDAIPAPRLRQIVEDAITQHIDPEHVRITLLAQRLEREALARMAEGDG